MAYTPTTWSSGDTITATKLNKIEQGIAGVSGILVVTATIDSTTGFISLNKTWQEIHDALMAGENVNIVVSIENTVTICFVDMVDVSNNIYSIHSFNAINKAIENVNFSTDSASGYPSQIIDK